MLQLEGVDNPGNPVQKDKELSPFLDIILVSKAVALVVPLL
jgi:hypothetical protein